MSLNVEWRQRVNAWIKELANHFYRKLSDVQLSGFVTDEQLSPETAADRNFAPMPEGTQWAESGSTLGSRRR